MHYQPPESAGPRNVEDVEMTDAAIQESGTFPFSRPVALPTIAGSAYSTAITLVQQVAYTLSDKIFAFSPETFDLDVAVKHWAQLQERNAYGFVPGVEALEVRPGAGSLALGYVFSPDFDISKRHIPQSIIASSGSLPSLRQSLDQLSLLYSLSNPFVGHISSAGYVGGESAGLTSDYTEALELADEIGLGLVSSASRQEVQHMSLFATLLSKVLPTLHVYEGVTAGRETYLAHKLLDQASLATAFQSVLKQLASTESKHSDNEGKTIRLLNAFNGALRTQYRPFEYTGPADAEHVVVVFGTVEASAISQANSGLARNGHKIGTVNVRVYRPFIEEEFVQSLPKSVKSISVLGQVKDQLDVEDNGVHSRLYQDVLSALTFSAIAARNLSVKDTKYSTLQTWDNESVLALAERLAGFSVSSDIQAPHSDHVYSFWSLNDSSSATVPRDVARLLAQSGVNIEYSTEHDNLLQGGASKADITLTSKTNAGGVSKAPASVAFVSSEKLLKEIDIPSNIRVGGSLLIALPSVNDEDLVKKVPEPTRIALLSRGIQLWILDTSVADAALEASLVQQSFLKVSGLLGEASAIPSLADGLDKALRKYEIPDTWAEAENPDEKAAVLPKTLNNNSFLPFNRLEEEASANLEDWTIAAKGTVFKEAYGTETSVRPDVGVKTSIVHVKEHRRLTPLSYDRNVFHIEFDLGDSGLTYAIGEALGIHAENIQQDVEEFIRWYGLNPDEVVQIPNRDDPTVLENRTVYQSLMQNVDIFGRPPKRFYEALSEFATDENEKKNLLTLSLPEGATEFKRRAEVDTITFADVFVEFPSARPSFPDLVRIVSPMKRREYSIASSQHTTPNSVALLIVTVGWTDPQGRDRFGQATRYLNSLKVGAPVTVSVKPSVMKLPTKSTAPIIMAGLGTGLAPFRAFVQERAYQKHVLGQEIGSVMLYLGSRHQREEYLYGEEWEAYQAAGIITLIGKAFSRDQPQKIYIQDRMRQTQDELRQAYIRDQGSFYLCGPTWPVPDVTEVLQEVVEAELKAQGAKKVDSRREIETLKEDGRYVLEVY
jgi:sulfite reductase (NADPH) flavoprotein alpha-component